MSDEAEGLLVSVTFRADSRVDAARMVARFAEATLLEGAEYVTVSLTKLDDDEDGGDD